MKQSYKIRLLMLKFCIDKFQHGKNTIILLEKIKGKKDKFCAC